MAVGRADSATSSMTPEYRALVVRLIRDNWAAEAANLSLEYHSQVLPLHLAPTMADRARLAAYWADECRHALLFAGLLADLGEAPSDAEYGDVRPGELLRLPIESWVELGLFQLFADTAGCVHLADYRTCSYAPLRVTAREVLADEGRHVRLGMANLRAALATPDGRHRATEVLPAWYRAALGMFGRPDRPSRRDAALVEAGLRRQLNTTLRARYRTTIDRALGRLGLVPPEGIP
jgi:1,2-phenylacetyl-CoA epoxidase catalytic subunit